MEWVKTLGMSFGAFLLVLAFADMAHASKPPFRVYRVITKTVVRDFYNRSLAQSFAELNKTKIIRLGEDDNLVARKN